MSGPRASLPLIPVDEFDSIHNRSEISRYLCCFKMKIGIMIYSTLDAIFAFAYFIYWLATFIANRKYQFIRYNELSLFEQSMKTEHGKEFFTSSEYISRKELITKVLEKCGGEKYVREINEGAKRFQYDCACIIGILSSIGLCLAGIALLLSASISVWRLQVLRKFGKYRKRLLWFFVWSQIPWMFLLIIGAILIYGENLCEIDVETDYRHYILWWTIVVLLLYKPHEMTLVVFYIRETQDNAKAFRRALIQQRRLERMKLRESAEEEEEGPTVSNSISAVDNSSIPSSTANNVPVPIVNKGPSDASRKRKRKSVRSDISVKVSANDDFEFDEATDDVFDDEFL